MFLNKISRYYLATYFYVLISVIAVVIGFESLLHILKAFKNLSINSSNFSQVMASIFLDIPHKTSDFLPLAIYIAFGIQQYLWHQKRQWMIVCILGFRQSSFKALKLTHYLALLIFSTTICWFIAPMCKSWSNEIKERNFSSKTYELTSHDFLQDNKFYKLYPNNKSLFFNFKTEQSDLLPWRLSGKILYVGSQPILDIEILESERYKFEENNIFEKIHYSEDSPVNQKAIVEKSLTESLLNPVCCLLSLLLAWTIFRIKPYARTRSAPDYFTHVVICSCIFLTQNILPTIVYFSWAKGVVLFCILTLLLLIMLLSSRDIIVD